MSIQKKIPDEFLSRLFGPPISDPSAFQDTAWLDKVYSQHRDTLYSCLPEALSIFAPQKEPSMTTLRPVPADISGPLEEVLELSRLWDTLLDVLRFALARWPSSLAEVTSALRTGEEDAAVGGSGLHVLGRALDLRTKDLPGGHEAIYPLAHAINERWTYDPNRPYKNVAVVVPHGTGPHLHLQVHPETRERES